VEVKGGKFVEEVRKLSAGLEVKEYAQKGNLIFGWV
jgi:hypothetical protein